MIKKNLAMLIVFMPLLATSQNASAVPAPDCTTLARLAESAHGLPDGILQSISSVEASRIQPDGTYKAWPWTLNDAGKGLFFDSANEVLTYLEAHMSHPDKSIDVGCMQINTKWHGAYFETFEEMLDPKSNIAYAAVFLSDLYHAHGTWEDAIRHYHSNTASRNGPYLERVLATWSSKNPDGVSDGIKSAVFRPAQTPLGTAADDAFSRALAAAKQAKTASDPAAALPGALPVILPVILPAPKPKRLDIKTGDAAKDTQLAGMAKSEQIEANLVQATLVTAASIPAVPKPVKPVKRTAPKPVDPDAAIKNKQRNLIAEWDRVLMFRAQLAASK